MHREPLSNKCWQSKSRSNTKYVHFQSEIFRNPWSDSEVWAFTFDSESARKEVKDSIPQHRVLPEPGSSFPSIHNKHSLSPEFHQVTILRTGYQCSTSCRSATETFRRTLELFQQGEKKLGLHYSDESVSASGGCKWVLERRSVISRVAKLPAV